MAVDTTDVMGRMLATSGVWEPAATAAFRSLLSPGDVCVDVGAHVGYYTLLASKLVGPAGHVFALEPAPSTFEALSSNLASNAVTNVTALRFAAGAAHGRAALYDPPSGNAGRASIASPAVSPSGGDRASVPTTARKAASEGHSRRRGRLHVSFLPGVVDSHHRPSMG